METPVLGQTLAQALEREWLVTDGLGGYASGTVPGIATRRYHGLLVAPLTPPLGRTVLLAKLEETWECGEQRHDLSANEFHDGTIYPHGYERLVDFGLAAGLPVWRFAAGDSVVEKRVWMERGQSTTYISYTLHGGRPGTLYLSPLCAFRDFHHETIGSIDWHFGIEPLADGCGLTVRAFAGATPYHLLGLPPDGRRWVLGGQPGWWWRFAHRQERERGLDFLEDLFCAGTVTCDLHPGETLLLAATIHDPQRVRVALAEQRLRAPTPAVAIPLVAASGGVALPAPEFVAQLQRAAHQFLVARDVPAETPRLDAQGVPEARTVLAGYHWFGDWGRDTMIALPGLALATGRHAEARAILRAFAHYVDRGMLPNRFPDSGSPLGDGDYNTLDATLWYFHAVDAVDRLTAAPPGAEGPDDLVAQVYPILREVVDWHVRGTRFGIRVDPADGLVRADDPQLTWMDAKVGDWVVTPRGGKPVEIAALWHHALALMVQWGARLGRPTAEVADLRALREKAATGIREQFWCDPGGHLFDIVDGPAGHDPSLRPNQIIAASLADFPISAEQRRMVVDLVAQRLWTPRGLRTLSPSHPRYAGKYGGDTWRRDGAYHQGTVWPWLLGPFVDAHLLVYGDRAAARAYVAPLADHLLADGCVGSISEIFDGDAPHAARGCIAQAWSISEVYRAWLATEPASGAPAATINA